MLGLDLILRGARGKTGIMALEARPSRRERALRHLMYGSRCTSACQPTPKRLTAGFVGCSSATPAAHNS